ncbi:DUF5615 family PIN-like protein [bacterium]|nr:DUF5615 family PIN-like protein [bacterium]
MLSGRHGSGSGYRWLRDQGHDALHLREEGLQRMADSDVLEKARRESECS